MIVIAARYRQGGCNADCALRTSPSLPVRALVVLPSREAEPRHSGKLSSLKLSGISNVTTPSRSCASSLQLSSLSQDAHPIRRGDHSMSFHAKTQRLLALAGLIAGSLVTSSAIAGECPAGMTKPNAREA